MIAEAVPCDAGTFDPDTYKAPFPYIGGKSLIASEVWARFGDVPNYVEPFFGSGSVLFKRPMEHEWWNLTETVNDADGMVANFWRALQADPQAVAEAADWPVSECDLHARHAWLKGQREDLTRRLEGDPEFFDAKVAGWWVWATCLWIGTGFDADGPWVVVDGELVCISRERGVKRQRPHLGNAGMGIHRQLPHLGDAGMGECDLWSEHLRTYMQSLADRLRRVRVCCGDWSRVTGPTPTYKHGLTGVFLDPPYSQDERCAGCYAVDRPGVAAECLQWCLANGENPRLRIALCGYAGEGHEPLEDAGWSVLAWKAAGGYSGQRKNGTNDNKHRERIWFSPACLGADADAEPSSDALHLEV
jgi:DNA adenine methylase